MMRVLPGPCASMESNGSVAEGLSRIVMAVDLQRFQKARDHIVGRKGGGELKENPTPATGPNRRKDRVRHLDLPGHRIRVGEHGPRPLIEQIGVLPVGKGVKLRL